MDPSRLELYDLLREELRDETARKLVLALPSEPEELVTKDFLRAAMAEQTDRLTWRMITIMGAWTLTATGLFAFTSQLFR